MPIKRALRLAPILDRMCLGSGVTVVFVGVAVLLGWAIGLPALQSIVAGWPTMKVNTAVCFILTGLSLLAWQRAMRVGITTAPGLRMAAFAPAGLVLLVALLTLAEYAFDWDPGLDQLFLGNGVVTDLAPPGRMSQGTAALFLLCCVSLLLAAGKRLAIGFAQACASLTLLMALLMLLSYLLGADFTKVTPFSTMAVHTAFAFASLSMGLLVLRGGEGWFSVFMQDSNSARNSRRYLLGTLLVLPLFAVLGMSGERDLHWYGPYFGMALLTVGGIAALAALNWHATSAGNAADRKVANMQRVLATLSGINTLIVRVRDKQALFEESCRIATEVGQFPLAWIATFDAEARTAQIHVARGAAANHLSERMPRTLNLAPENPGPDGLMRRVIATKATVVMNEIEFPPTLNAIQRKHRQELVDGGIQSLVALPLIIEGKVVGTFALHAELAGFFNAAELELLEEMAGDIAFAINHIDKDAALKYLAFYDPLTGLPNRALFMERLHRQLKESARNVGKVVVLLGNLRRFRLINETFGRHVGDELLRQLASRMKQVMEYPENLARIDGDSFATFMPTLGAAHAGHRIQAVFNQVLDRPFRIGDQDLIVDATLAVAVFPADGTDGETLMANVATALRRAQDTGERSMFYEAAMNAKVADAVKLEFKLRRAVELGQLELHYQPKVDFATRRVQSVEALMRWRDPESGLVPPGRFIPVMEEIGLIGQAGAWAIRQAVADLGRLRAMGLPTPRCAVNVSAIQLRDPDFVHTVLDELAGFGDDDVKLDIEITESLIMQDVQQTIRVLQTLRGVGIEVAIDDFGTGYSSLAYLVQLPLNALKIDRAFVLGLDQGRQSVMIVQSIMSLAHSLKLQVVAEGVETEAQAAQLHDMGCDLMQGYLFSKPLPFDQLVALLKDAD
ncbi:MAG: GGDEF domain-containing protein [Rhodoferax sp.]|nr:GGDEF domain-containing protein [Rhodoferax sp.]